MHDDVDCAHHDSQGAFLLILNRNMDAQMETILSSVDQTKATTHLSNTEDASGVVGIKKMHELEFCEIQHTCMHTWSQGTGLPS